MLPDGCLLNQFEFIYAIRKKLLNFKVIALILTVCMAAMCCNIGVAAEGRSQINVLPNTNTNIFDKDMLKLLSEITKKAAQSDNVSIYYSDVKTGYYFSYNSDKIYASASTIKAVYCQYILQSGTELTEKIKLTSATKSSSSGKLTKSAVGEYFTVKDLMEYAIVYSDNMAYRLLYERFGYKGFNAYIKSLGLKSPQLGSTKEYTNVTAKEMGKCMKEIYRYSEETENTFLVELMKKTTSAPKISKGTKFVTAHKYGYKGEKNGYHDIAIVYADEPYVLSIFTNVDGNAENCNEIFAELSSMVEKLHNNLHTENSAASIKTVNTSFESSKASDKITLEWSAFGNADKYIVYKYNSSSNKYEQYKTVETEQCTIKNLSPDTAYKFKVYAVKNENGKYIFTAVSKAVSVKTAASVTRHIITYEEYMELCDENGKIEIIDDCTGDCEYYVEGIGVVC